MTHLLMGRTRKLRAALVAAVAVASMALAIGPAAAQANWSLKELPGHTWTIVENYRTMHGQYAHVESGSTLCVGPVIYSGGWVAPYGWGCRGGGSVEWEPAPGGVNAYPAVYNPNGGTFYNLYGVTW
jgi:hypothetical protein